MPCHGQQQLAVLRFRFQARGDAGLPLRVADDQGDLRVAAEDVQRSIGAIVIVSHNCIRKLGNMVQSIFQDERLVANASYASEQILAVPQLSVTGNDLLGKTKAKPKFPNDVGKQAVPPSVEFRIG